MTNSMTNSGQVDDIGSSPSVKVYLIISAASFAGSLLAYLIFDAELATWLNDNCKTIRRSPWLDAAKSLARVFVPLWLVALHV